MLHWFQRLYMVTSMLDRLFIHISDGLMTNFVVRQHAVGGQEVNDHLRYTRQNKQMCSEDSER